MKLENLALRWLAEQQYAETTRRTYMQTVRQLALRFPLPAERITADHLIDFLTLDPSGAATHRASATSNRHRTTLRCFFRWAHRRGFLRTDPAASLDDVSLGRGRRRAGRWLTRDQARHLLDAIDIEAIHHHRDRTLILTALLTGLRRSELAAMKWRDLDVDNGRLSVFGKGAKPAVIGVPAEALDALNGWRQRAASAAPIRPASPTFPTGQHVGGLYSDREYRVSWRAAMTPANVCKVVARHASDAGLGIVGTHDLRRTFAGWLDEDGIDLAGIQAALRHSSPGVTVSCYLDPSPRRAVEAVRGLRLGGLGAGEG